MTIANIEMSLCKIGNIFIVTASFHSTSQFSPFFELILVNSVLMPINKNDNDSICLKENF